MQIAIELNGHVREVTVERLPTLPDRFRVSWEGQSLTVDARCLDQDNHGRTLSLVLLDGEPVSHQIRLAKTTGGGREVHVAGAVLHARIGDWRAGFTSSSSDTRDSEKRVKAPMPGKVVRVLVEPGDEVVVRQPLVVVEAMKMENELVSSREGTVKVVTVSEGMSVDAGHLLVVIE